MEQIHPAVMKTEYRIHFGRALSKITQAKQGQTNEEKGSKQREQEEIKIDYDNWWTREHLVWFRTGEYTSVLISKVQEVCGPVDNTPV